MSKVYLLEPTLRGAAWAPFAGVTAIAELRAGAWRIHERWSTALGVPAAGVIAPTGALTATPGKLALVTEAAVTGPAWVVDATFVPKIPMRPVGQTKRLVHAGKGVAWRLDSGQKWEGPFERGDGLVVDGRVLRGAFDLVTALETFLFDDVLVGLDGPTDPIPSGSIVLGNPGAIALRSAEVEPGVVFDARQGGIILERGVKVRSGTRIEGPAWIREGTWLVGGDLRVVSAGPHCRLHGEISTSVFAGFDNKSHDGFVGHSVIGEWVNLGAGTITSNLKNTYGPVRLDVGAERIDTARTNLGALIGDHVKTAIGTLLPTGAVLGAGANLFGPPRAPKYVPPFAWGGDTDERHGVDQFIAIAKRVLPRREVAVDAAMEASLRALHARLVQGT